MFRKNTVSKEIVNLQTSGHYYRVNEYNYISVNFLWTIFILPLEAQNRTRKTVLLRTQETVNFLVLSLNFENTVYIAFGNYNECFHSQPGELIANNFGLQLEEGEPHKKQNTSSPFSIISIISYGILCWRGDYKKLDNYGKIYRNEHYNNFAVESKPMNLEQLFICEFLSCPTMTSGINASILIA